MLQLPKILCGGEESIRVSQSEHLSRSAMLHTLLSCSLSRMMIDNSFTAGPTTVKVSTRMLSYWMSQLNTIPGNTFITCYLLTLMMQNPGYIVLNQICPEKGRYNCWKCWSAVHKVCCHKFSPCRPLKTIAC